jgi:hypothetical protein
MRARVFGYLLYFRTGYPILSKYQGLKRILAMNKPIRELVEDVRILANSAPEEDARAVLIYCIKQLKIAAIALRQSDESEMDDDSDDDVNAEADADADDDDDEGGGFGLN